MERLKENKLPPPKRLIITGMVMLVVGMFFGVIGSLQYVSPGLWKSILSFDKVRPLHVSSIVFWILLTASGGVLTYAGEYAGRLFSTRLSQFQWLFFLVAIVAIGISYVNGVFGGREYWECPPILALFVVAGWLLFAINIIGTLRTLKNQPVYVWMWLTGAVGFLLIFLESYLWLLPYFQQTIVRDMTVQWKSYGSMVGCWNMLIYGSGIFLMEKISCDQSYARSRIAFVLFFLGLINLMFNWSHHIYILPIQPVIKHIGYLISMTELYILGRIIYKWKESLSSVQKYKHLLAFRFLSTADVWVFINLGLAILMSVPAINLYTHGTHITVAHVMGTTIGINSMILMAVVVDVLEGTCLSLAAMRNRISTWLLVANVALVVFFGSLITAGVLRARWQMSNQTIPFGEMMKGLAPYFVIFSISGIILFVCFFAMVFLVLKSTLSCYFYRSSVQEVRLKSQWQLK